MVNSAWDIWRIEIKNSISCTLPLVKDIKVKCLRILIDLILVHNNGYKSSQTMGSKEIEYFKFFINISVFIICSIAKFLQLNIWRVPNNYIKRPFNLIRKKFHGKKFLYFIDLDGDIL